MVEEGAPARRAGSKAEFLIVLVPGEAERCHGRERRRGRRTPGWVAARAECIVAPLLDDGASLVRERLDGAEANLRVRIHALWRFCA